MSARGARYLAVLLVLPLVELVTHVGIRAGVTPMDDWRRAAEFVRGRHRNVDQVRAAPDWAGPTLRQVLGDVLSMDDVGASDLARYERLWTLSIRGAQDAMAPERSPDLEREFGGVTVRRWDLGDSPVDYDFVAHLAQAEANVGRDGSERSCRWRRSGRPRGGAGLGQGPVAPARRFVCDRRRSWAWIGRTMHTDLDLEPRWCIWQHPMGERPVRVTYRDVPLGERIVLYGGLHFTGERRKNGPPVHVRVEVEGRNVGRMVHRDGEGWKRMVALTRPPEEAARAPEATGDVTVSVTAARPHKRNFCWAATVRSGDEREGR